MHILISNEEICPGLVVCRGLELELVNKDGLVVEITHEVLNLREHAYMVCLELSTDVALAH